MKSHNAQLILNLKIEAKEHFGFKSSISHDILLYLASNRGKCELSHLFKRIDATSIAIRYHIKYLEMKGYIVLKINTNNKRTKNIELTAKGNKLMNDYDVKLEAILSQWSQDKLKQ